MSNHKKNSQDYWNHRFINDWEEYGGNEQTKFFATLLNGMLPDWLVHEVNTNRDTICDLGCAEGDALPVYKQIFMTSEIVGEDFSQEAIQLAQKNYPEFNFKVSDILLPEGEEKYPVIICSNVIEHFKDTYKVISKICERATKYTIILVPYREKLGQIDEHERVFHTCDFPMQVENNHLVYAKSVNCDSIYYPYEQIVLIYSKCDRFAFLSEIVENISDERELLKDIHIKDINAEIQKLYQEEEEKNAKLSEIEIKVEVLEKQLAEKQNELIVCRNTLLEKEGALGEVKDRECVLQMQIEEAKERENYLNLKAEEAKAREEQLNLQAEEAHKAEKVLRNQVLNSEQQAIELQVKTGEILKTLKNEREKNSQIELQVIELNRTITNLMNELAITQKNYASAMSVLEQKNEYMIQTQELCNHYATGKLSKLNHFLFRIKGQLLNGTKEDKKEFWCWLKGRIKGTNRTLGAGVTYNPWMVVKSKLGEGIFCNPTIVTFEGQEMVNNFLPLNEVTSKENFLEVPKELTQGIKQILQQDYTNYDVIILSVIDYNFRHQRPQHFATRFAANGHRVFYVNANFIRPDSISLQQDNLYIVDFASSEHNAIYSMNGMDTLEWMKQKFEQLIYSQAIRDAVVVVDYPNWVYGAEFIREKYGFKIITDYMDDYTGFLGTAEDFLKNNCLRLLKQSDVVVASSQFLYDVASRYIDKDKIAIVRNGTEVEHFYQAIGLESKQKVRQVIGYYGAVAHWFAWEKVCYLAEQFPECDVVIVGDVTEYRDKLEKHKNIQLLGEKPYKELPKYLAEFDVCLIPFDTSTDLIKATNPVKFYEYLSAGKKVVATEIPELMPFRDEYVYMSNNDEQFAEYVKLCLMGEDKLQGKEECIEFARENDWQKRYEHFESACIAQIPMISIVVLAYNNLSYNKQCIESILKKTAYANYELIIVDNQSTDGTIEYLQDLENQKISNVRVIFNNQNSGFAGGNNLGIKEAKGDYILLLNNDTVVTRGWLTAMSKHLENEPRYGMCNPVTNSIGNESMVRARYSNIKEMHEYAYAFTAETMGQLYIDVDRLPLFATLIRREVIDMVGMLDESYKVGMFEDDDYTEMVKNAGFDIVIVDDAFIHHINNGSFKKLDDSEYKKIFNANKAIFEKKWKKEWTMPKYREGVTAVCNENVTI